MAKDKTLGDFMTDEQKEVTDVENELTLEEKLLQEIIDIISNDI